MLVLTGGNKMNDMKDYNEKIEEKLNSGESTTFKKYRFYTSANRMDEIDKKYNAICPKGHEIVIMIDDESAITKSFSPSFEDYPFSIVFESRVTNCYYKSIDHALLSYLGVKHGGLNEKFSTFAYRALTGKDI